MHDHQDPLLRSLLLLLSPALFFLLGIFSSRVLNQHAAKTANTAVWLSGGALGTTLISMTLLIVQGPFVATLASSGPAAFTL